ncbi:rod shape-determining protein MreC [Candidatus Symbiobacter mobilis]|uniref:Cell shape-determining protein MreC n=1 Tax=Candidatus Symbiobacter mobilis CR TaxID=946483 RepID=U5N4S5_9BURK|nr:rod shape-determining protein MreC [Candidatus Symbiobacter mobilis]AGX86496.1 rod shape-determining protein MreC [Candidatus Symbiobacter mobilis CR]
MQAGTLGSAPSPFFKQGPPALLRLLFFGALSLLFMVGDARLGVMQPIRTAIAVVLYPVQMLLLRPVAWMHGAAQYFHTIEDARAKEAAARHRSNLLSQRAQQVEQLILENARLRSQLGLRERLPVSAQAAQVLYDVPDPYARKLVIDKGGLVGVVQGSPVLDENGVLGQVTRVYPMSSEVTLLIDKNQAIPVLNVRSGVRGLAFGDGIPGRGTLELRFLQTNVDMAPGDLLTTSGIDGVYPPGLSVARVLAVDRVSDSAFARISCLPVARMASTVHVLVLQPLLAQASTAEAVAPPQAASH